MTTTEMLFNIHLVFGYIAWALCFFAYLWPRLKAMPAVEAHRAIATLHSFRFFGLAFLIPGVVGNLPPFFASFVAWGDFATAVLAIVALLAVRLRPLFWTCVVAFNVIGTIDLLGDYFNAIRLGVPAHAGEMGAVYFVPVIYVPILMITHFAAFWLLARRRA